MNELWRVQGQTGAVRMMSLDDIDRAFNAGYLHAGTNVLAPGSMTWQTLGEAAGLDEEAEQTPSLSPMAISGPASYALPYIPHHAALGDDAFGAGEKKSRKGLVFGVVVAAAAAACAFAVVSGKVNVASHTATAAVAPPAVETVLPPAATATQQPKAEVPKGLTDEMKQRLLDADKANKKKAGKGKHRLVRTQDEADTSQPIPKSDGKPLVEGGDKFDPLNGSL